MEIEGYVTEVTPDNRLKFYPSDQRQKSAAIGGVLLIFVPLSFIAFIVWGIASTFNDKPSQAPIDNITRTLLVLLLIPMLLFLMGSVQALLTAMYGRVTWYASSNLLERETCLWGKCKMKTYTDCIFKIDRNLDNQGRYIYSQLVAENKQRRKFTVLDSAQDVERLVGFAHIIGAYTGWILDGAPPGQAKQSL